MRSVALAALLALVAFSCGRGGDSSGSDDDEESPPTGGVLQPGAKSVTGLVLLSTGLPAKGYELWLVDHTAPSFIRQPLDDSGAFTMPLAYFIENHVYSLHLVRDYVYLGDVDFSPANAGTQAAIVYAGGYGFDTGTMTVALDAHGKIDRAAMALQAQVGGGFALKADEDGTLAAYPVPTGAAAVGIGSRLVVLDPSTLLHSFYRSNQNAALYAKDLAALSRIGLGLTAKDDGGMERVFVAEGGKWLKSARQPPTDDASPADSPFWSTAGYEGAKIDGTHMSASAYVGALPDEGTMVVLRTQPTGGTQASVPRALPRVLGQPPQVMAADVSGGTPSVVDYASDTAVNGVTKPFCQTGDVTLTLAPPTTLAGAAVPGTVLEIIDVELDYYGLAAGKSTRLVPTADQFAAPYNTGVEDTELSDITRNWDPTRQRVRFTLGATAGAATTHTIKFWKELAPAGLGGLGVANIRLRIYYRSESDATEGGTVVWLTHSC